MTGISPSFAARYNVERQTPSSSAASSIDIVGCDVGSGSGGEVDSVVVRVVVMQLEGEREAPDATNEFTDFSLPAGAKR